MTDTAITSRRSGRRASVAHDENEDTAIGLVNSCVSGTRGVFERIGSVAELEQWLARRELRLGSAAIDDHDLLRFRELRRDSRTLFSAIENGGRVPGVVLARLNRMAAAPVRVKLVASPDGYELHYVPTATGVDPLGALARAVLELAASDAVRMVRTCAADDCDRMFLLPHGRQVWCSPECGNRMRVNRHLQRRRAKSSGT